MADFSVALKRVASVRGDVDTNCAIVGGIVVMYTGVDNIPPEWIARREGLPKWPFEDEGLL